MTRNILAVHGLLNKTLVPKLETSKKILAKSPFSECSAYTAITAYGSIRTFSIPKSKPQCFHGSIILGADDDWEISNAIININGSWEYSNNTKRGIASLGSVVTGISYQVQQPITLVKCTGKSDACKVQVMAVPPSYIYRIKNEYTDTTTGFKSIVSTKREGEMKFGIKSKGNVDTKTYFVTNEFTWTNALISGPNRKLFSYERQKGVSFSIDFISVVSQTSRPLKGDLGYGTKMQAYTQLDIAEYSAEAIQNGVKHDGTNYELSLTTKFMWKDASSGSNLKHVEADSEEEFLIPEFTATLSTEGGTFTVDNVDTDFPTDDKKGLSTGAIVGIVIAVILVIAIIAILVWPFAFGGINKFKKDGTTPENKEENEP